MEVELWKECLTCKNKGCCKLDIAYPLFVTPKETERIEKLTHNQTCFNKDFPCSFFNENGLCDIHSIRPTDCRLFPFDILKINGEFFWVIWEIDCSIVEYNDFDLCLKRLEEEIIPYFKEYLDEYSKFRVNEFIKRYNYKIIRRVNLD